MEPQALRPNMLKPATFLSLYQDHERCMKSIEGTLLGLKQSLVTVVPHQSISNPVCSVTIPVFICSHHCFLLLDLLCRTRQHVFTEIGETRKRLPYSSQPIQHRRRRLRIATQVLHLHRTKSYRIFTLKRPQRCTQAQLQVLRNCRRQPSLSQSSISEWEPNPIQVQHLLMKQICIHHP
jgi:hypothetical protein